MRTRLRKARCDESGVTLIELMVVMVFMGIMGVAFTLVFSSSIRHSTEIGKQSDLETAFRGALDPMVRELRQAYSGTASSPIETIAASGTPLITFTTPDRDCVGASCAFHLRRISYRLSGGSFQRAAYVSTDNDGAPWTWPSGSPPASWVTLITGVTTTTPFTFLDGVGATTTTAANVRSVTTTLTAGTNTGGASRNVTYSITASLREST
jgi:type II secretory pathway component PulJ